jgi:hypothetical protein
MLVLILRAPFLSVLELQWELASRQFLNNSEIVYQNYKLLRTKRLILRESYLSQ